jgi:hypothetical protein
VITGGGKWVEIKITADSLYQHLLLTAEKKFWRRMESSVPPRLWCRTTTGPHRGGADRRYEFVQCLGGVLHRLPPHPRAYLEHENAKTELKGLMPEDAKEASGHGLRAKRSKSGAVSFDVLSAEGTSHAPVQ